MSDAETIATALPAHGPWTPVHIDLPPGGPRIVFRGRDIVAWVASKGRLEAERRGRARIGDHPARPLARDADVLAFAPFGGPAPDPIAAVTGWPGTPQRIEGTRRDLLAALDSGVNVARALGRLGIARRVLDRWLAERVTAETDVGVSFGGVHPGWLRVQDRRVVCLRCDRARADGWRAVDLAGLGLDRTVEVDRLRAAHGEGEAREEAFELACVSVWTREHVVANDPVLAQRVIAIVGARRAPEPDEVRVWIDGPSFVDPGRLWGVAQGGTVVPSARARWLLANLDGLAVGGGRIAVRTEPKLRKPRRSPLREKRAVRRRRLFARWDQGIRTDDEGLVGATPEALARQIARGARGIVLDGTCGVGSLPIAYAREPGVTRVIAIDLDANRLAMAAHNARVYGVAHRIEFVHGDVTRLPLEADLLVLDPPWGGRDYDRERVTLDALGLNVRAVLARFEGPVVLKLPRSFDPTTLPAGFTIEPLTDERGVLKMLIARR